MRDVENIEKIKDLVNNMTLFFFIKLGLKLFGIYKRVIMSDDLWYIFVNNTPVKCINCLAILGLDEA